jgi:transposase
MQRDYYAGSSIRNLAARHRLSYGTVHALLLDVETQLRPRGGARRRPPKAD